MIPSPAADAYWSVRTYLVWLVLASLLPGVIGATVLFVYEYQVSRVQQQKATVQTARALVQAVDNHLLRAQSVAQTLSSSDSLARHDLALFHQQARKALATSGLGTNVVIRDETGRQLLNTATEFGAPLRRDLPRSTRSVFKTGKPTNSDIFIGATLKRPIMSVDVPVIIDGKIAYALGVGILPEQFDTILKAQNLPPNWVAAILDGSGKIVGRTHTPKLFVGQQATPRLRAALATSSEGFLETTTKEGIPVVSFYSRSPTTHWSVAIGIPQQAIREALILPLSMLAIGVATLFGIGLILARFVSGRIEHSIHALIAPATALGSEVSAATPRVHIKEAAEVAGAIERAAGVLQERKEILLAQTAELTEAHRLAKFGTWHWNLTTGEIKTSASIAEIYGRAIPSFAEQRGTLLTIDSWNRVDAASQEAVRSGKGYDLELEINHGDGHRIWIESKCEAVCDKDQHVIGLRGTIQDITERKRYEEALRDSERAALVAAHQAEAERRRLDAVLEASPVGIVVADANGAVVQVNAENKRLWGENPPVVDGVQSYRSWHGWWADGSARQGKPLQPHEWPMARALRGEEARDIVEIESFEDPPVRRIVLISGAPIRDESDRIVGGVIAQMDITHRVNAEEALRQADRRKDEFLAMLAHELRNPLAPISAAAQVLALGRLDDARLKQTSAIITRQVKHMTGLVDDLLDVSRVTRGMVTLDKHELDVKNIVADALEQVKPLIEARGLHLSVHTPPGSATVVGDHKRLVQVVTNLLNNAAKFTPAGGEVVLKLAVDEDHVELTVADTGIGMAPELVTNAFALFTQGERSPDRSQGGLGIGLALVKSLVELHGGTVTAYSDGAGKGSRFAVFLPHRLKQAIPSPVEELANRPPVSGGALQVLVVDDNVDAAQTLAMFVEILGHHALVEHSSKKALERVKTDIPNVCLLDIGLPEIDGNELARRLRADPRTAAAVLVAVTGYGREDDRKEALAAGFNHYFVKPFDTRKLADLLSEIARREKPDTP